MKTSDMSPPCDAVNPPAGEIPEVDITAIAWASAGRSASPASTCNSHRSPVSPA